LGEGQELCLGVGLVPRMASWRRGTGPLPKGHRQESGQAEDKHWRKLFVSDYVSAQESSQEILFRRITNPVPREAGLKLEQWVGQHTCDFSFLVLSAG
jgi:hypothetical protein